MNINQLIYIVLLLYLLFHYCNQNIYENFDENIDENKISSCLKRIINNECLDDKKKLEINNECGLHSILLETAKVNIRCDDKILINTLLCKKMKLEGACDSDYGRKQMRGLCYDRSINIKCPVMFDQTNIAIVQKVHDIEKELQKCEEKDKIDKIDIIPDKECECNTLTIVKKINPLIIIPLLFLFLLFKKNRKK